jgi:hypothetical protein
MMENLVDSSEYVPGGGELEDALEYENPSENEGFLMEDSKRMFTNTAKASTKRC